MNGYKAVHLLWKQTDSLSRAMFHAHQFLNIDQLMNNSQLEARELLVEVDQPTFGKVKIVNSPFHFLRLHQKQKDMIPD